MGRSESREIRRKEVTLMNDKHIAVRPSLACPVTTWSMLFTEARRMTISSFSIFTYIGSLYLQKKTFISCSRILGLFCTIRLMFLRATYWISGSELSRVTRGGVSFLLNILKVSWLVISSIYLRMTRTADITTAELACCRRGATRSMMPSASLPSRGV